MATTETLPEEEESILNNLSKTRQLWSSKADIGDTNYLFPKSPKTPTTPNRNRFPSTSETTPTEVVRADEQVVEDYELPDINSMKSQFESKSAPVPMPVQKAPAAKAKEDEKRNSVASSESNEVPVPVNREEIPEETYEVELGKLKAQFETAAKNAVKRPKSPQRNPVSKAAIQDHVTRSRISTNKKQQGKKVVKKTRFEDEIVQHKSVVTSEEFTETSVDLSSLKSQFEGRKDDHLVAPASQANKTKTPNATPRAVENGTEIEVVRPDDPVQEEHYDVELGALKKRFETTEKQTTVTPKPKASIVKRASLKKEIKEEEPEPQDQSAAMEDSPRVETVKSYEPVYEEMVGEESVKERLQRYKSMTESTKKQNSVQRKPSQKKVSAPPKEPVSPAKSEELAEAPRSPAPSNPDDLEIVRSPPAGTKITPDYVPSVDLHQTKALFEKDEPKPAARRSSLKRPSSAASTESSPRIGRNPDAKSPPPRSNSSRHSSASPSSRSSSNRVRTISANSSNPADSDTESMSHVVRPPPAGTKETPDYVPSLKISSVKSMFEKPKTSSPDTPTGAPRPRRQLNNSNWVNGNEPEANKTTEDGRKIVAEGSYEERAGGVVRPPTAGTKERPAYSLSADFLKSRAAMFEAPKDKGYQPRNKIQGKPKAAPAEVVNAAGEKEVPEYELSQNMKDTKKMFEAGGAVSPEKPTTPKQTEIVKTPQGEVVRPPPAGTRDDTDIVPASDLGSAKKMFEQQNDAEPEAAPRKAPIDIRQEAEEAVNRDKEIKQERSYDDDSKESAAVESESDTEGEYLLDKDQNQAPAEERAQEQEEPAQEEEAAAITPVRVAVPDSPEPEEQQEVEPKAQDEPVQEPEQEYVADATPAQEPEQEYVAEDTPAQDQSAQEEEFRETIIIDDHLLKTEEGEQEEQTARTEEPQAEEPAPATEEYDQPEQEERRPADPIIEDHLLRSEEVTTNGMPDSPEGENQDSYAGQTVEKPAAVTENGGAAVAQEADGGSYLD